MEFKKTLDIGIKTLGFGVLGFIGVKTFINSIEITKEIRNVEDIVLEIIEDRAKSKKQKELMKKKKFWAKNPQELYFTEFFPKEFDEQVYLSVVNDPYFKDSHAAYLHNLKALQDNGYAAEYADWEYGDKISWALSPSQWALSHPELWLDEDDGYAKKFNLKLDNVKSASDLPITSIILAMKKRVAEKRIKEIERTGIDPFSEVRDSHATARIEEKKKADSVDKLKKDEAQSDKAGDRDRDRDIKIIDIKPVYL